MSAPMLEIEQDIAEQERQEHELAEYLLAQMEDQADPERSEGRVQRFKCGGCAAACLRRKSTTSTTAFSGASITSLSLDLALWL